MAHLLRTFRAQTVPDKQLVVVDDSPVRSDVMHVASQLDSRVVYDWRPQRRTIGAKRSEAIARSDGDVIVHVDDDDSYAPAWGAHCAGTLVSGYDLCKLCVSRTLRVSDGSIWRSDSRKCGGMQYALTGIGQIEGPTLAPPDAMFCARGLNGYGFSLAFTRALWQRIGGFKDMSLGEDVDFVERAIAAGARIKHIDDAEEMVLHRLHPASTSTIFPQEFLGYGAPPNTEPKSIAATAAWGAVGALVGAGLTAIGEQAALGRITGPAVAVGATAGAIAAGITYRVL